MQQQDFSCQRHNFIKELISQQTDYINLPMKKKSNNPVNKLPVSKLDSTNSPVEQKIQKQEQAKEENLVEQIPIQKNSKVPKKQKISIVQNLQKKQTNVPSQFFPVQQVPSNFNQQVQMQNIVPPPMSNANYQQTFQPIIPQSQIPQQIVGGFYGRRNIQQKSQVIQPDVFNDDEQIIQKVKEEKKDAKIDITIKAQRSMAKLKQQVMLPAMVSLNTQGGSRTSVDLVCVIDVSGSMNGDKIELVKSTMKYLLEALTPADRLSIITFENWGERVCGLKCVSQQNMIAFNQYIDSLSARGGTNICSGLNLAVKTIKQRKQANKVTSVFLLSDGQDKGAEAQFKETLKNQEKNLGVFSIHSFGFGTDHDQELMTKICQLKDGSFYFIKELATLDEAFCNALGEIISLVATDVVIKLNCIAKNIVQGVKVNNTYGSMWKKLSENEYQIRILQLMSGITKDYVFEIHIPSINTEVGDLDRDHDILQAIFTAKGVNNTNMTGESNFKITLLNQNQQIPQINQNIDVIQNHLRVKAAQAIEQNLKKADQNQLAEAQKGIDDMIACIKSNKKARQEKMLNLVNDLENIKVKCQSNQVYQNQGKKWMKSAQIAHSMQNNYAYSNAVQQQMVIERKSKKSNN